MTVPAAIALVSAALALYVAALCQRLSAAPGWREQRWFSLAATSVAVFAALDVVATVPAPEAVVVWFSRGQVVMAGVHVYAWIRYSDHFVGARPTRRGVALRRVPLALGALALIPGVVFQDRVRVHTFAPLGFVYEDVIPTAFGEITLALVICLLSWVSVRYGLAWRRGARHAAVHCFSLLFLLAMVVNDALVTAGVLATPYLIDLGFFLPIGVVAYATTTRFAEDARALEELRDRLEGVVDERTTALYVAEAELYRSEKLAAIGRLAAGVAHEVNNPAAAAASNLQYLVDARARSGAWPADAEACVQDSMKAIDRIVGIVQQLSDAGSCASTTPQRTQVRLAEVAREGLHASRARCGERVRLEMDVDEDLCALGEKSVLVQVLVKLIVNGAQAIPGERRDGLVAVRGARSSGRVQLVVEDNGAGIAPEALPHLFEPFFSTRPFGRGAGLGLAVSRGLVQALGGELRLESGVPGARAVVDLCEAPRSPDR